MPEFFFTPWRDCLFKWFWHRGTKDWYTCSWLVTPPSTNPHKRLPLVWCSTSVRVHPFYTSGALTNSYPNRQNLFQSHQCMAQNCNEGMIPQAVEVGDMVFFKNCAFGDPLRKIPTKLCPRWRNPSAYNLFLRLTMWFLDPSISKIANRIHHSHLKLPVVNWENEWVMLPGSPSLP